MKISGWFQSVIAIVLLTLVWSGVAAAQGSPIIPETRPVLLGPVELHPSIAIRDVGSDSNVYSDSADTKADFTYTVSPRVHTVTPIGSGRLFAIGLADFVYYHEHEDQRSLDASIDGRYEVTDGRIRPFAAGGYNHRNDRGLEIEKRTKKTQARASVGTDVMLTGVTALTAWGHHEQLRYGSDELYEGVPLAEQLDRSSDSVAAGARFKVTPLTTIVAAVEFQRDRFVHTTLRDSDSVLVAPGFEFDSSAALSGRARAGFRQFTPRDDSLTGYRGFIGSADLSYSINRVKLDFNARHDVAYSYDVKQPYYLQSGGGANFSTRVVGPIELIVIGEQWLIRNQRVGGTSFDGRREVTTTVGGGLGYQLSKQMRLTLTIDRLKRTSDEAGSREYERRRTLGSFGYGF